MEQVCRTCLATCGDLVSIFSDDYYVHNLPAKLQQTIQIEVTLEDNLPKVMCKKCIFLVDTLYCFKDQCEMAEIKLKKSLQLGSVPDDNSQYSSILYDDKDAQNDSSKSQESSWEASSEDGYQVEFVSEEARLEFERAKKKKKKPKKNSGVKVKSVEILPNDKKQNILKNFGSNSSSILHPNNHDVENNQEILNKSEVEPEDNFVNNQSVGDCDIFSKSSEQSEELHLVSKSRETKRKLDNGNAMYKSAKVTKKVSFLESLKDDFQKKSNSNNIVNDNILDNFDVSTTVENSSGETKVRKCIDIKSLTANSEVMSFLQKLYFDDYYDEDSPTIYECTKRVASAVKFFTMAYPEFCTLCSQQFDTYNEVLKHKVHDHIPKANQYVCPVCKLIFPKKQNLINHLDEHVDVQSYTCLLCDKNYYTEASLVSHLTSHIDFQKLKCKLCDKTFSRPSGLVQHGEVHLKSEKLSCGICSLGVKSKAGLELHLEQEHFNEANTKFKCEVCGEMILEKNRERHMKNHSGYSCPYCQRTFVVKAILRDHVYSHLGVKQYTCLVCDKTFNTQTERMDHMQEHMKSVVDRKKFRCRICHTILTSRIAYSQHLKDKHMNCKQSSEILKELSQGCKTENNDHGRYLDTSSLLSDLS